MSLLLFSDDRVIYNDGEKGAVCSILIPKYSRIKKYGDITAPTDASVKERHGDSDDLPALWRQDGPYVYVYGNISFDLDEKRQTHNMYLPQDFVKEDVGAFYYVFGGKFVIHGVRTVTDDGHKVWGTSLISSSEEEALPSVISSISERMLEGKEEKIVVAVHNDEDALSQYKESLEPFEQEVVTFESLGKPRKNIKPLFSRKDKSFLMLTMSLCAFIALGWVVFLWVTTQLEFQSLQAKSDDLKNAIRIMQKNKVLGHITNPKDVLRVMDETVPLPPSTLLHGAGVAAAQLGEVRSIQIGASSSGKRGRGPVRFVTGGVMDINVRVNFPESSLLLDQERIAKTVIESTPWLKYIEKPVGTGGIVKLGVQVK
ncbi:MAG: hypothetical protein CMF61_03605 [Magnetococcales bacterium]|nr:hypothetical protein [Magnetococcales bacterium]PPR19556.1 MAG: hypothetical protein CFH43_00119 [Pseudomonadota bacterium]